MIHAETDPQFMDSITVGLFDRSDMAGFGPADNFRKAQHELAQCAASEHADGALRESVGMLGDHDHELVPSVTNPDGVVIGVEE